MSKKVALITGITGQDGAYLSEFLLKKGYIVWGLKRRSSLFNTGRIDHLFMRNLEDAKNSNFKYAYTDLTDSTNIIRLVQEIQPDEIYNLAAMSHVKVSFDTPEYSANADGIGTLRLLEAIRILGLTEKTKFYQASTSELYGKVKEVPQTEKTPFYPRSPYAVAKLYSYWITVNYREAYDIFACNGILFNHESPIRGETFVTRKITRGVANIALGFQKTLYLGNLNSKRDWGHAKDYIVAIYLMMQQNDPDDYVIATGRTTSVRDFVKKAFEYIGIDIEFQYSGIEEQGYIKNINYDVYLKKVGIIPKHLNLNQVLIRVDPHYFRPTEVDILMGNAEKAREKLGWYPKRTLENLIEDMMQKEILTIQKDDHIKNGGFEVIPNIEDIF